jgi:aryl-alcohol dehydrogenase-like predicted oxidoreductase
MVSAVGLGCNNFGRAESASQTQQGTNEVIYQAIDSGITFFDNADIYGFAHGLGETLMGNALKGRRDDIVLATKFGMDMAGTNGADWGARASRRYIRRAVEASLTRLQTDWIDLYQMHEPDGVTPVQETLSTLDDLITEGKVRYIGHSNLAGWQIADAEYTAELYGHPKFVSAQNEYNLLSRGAETEVLPAVNAYGLGFLPYYPLHNGILTGKYTRSGGPTDARVTVRKPHLMNQVNWRAMEEYQLFCDERAVNMVEATFAWMLAQEGVASVIAGANTPEQVAANASASGWAPSREDLATIDAIFKD